MRDELSNWAREFQRALVSEAPFTGSPLHRMVARDLPSALTDGIAQAPYRFLIKGSVGSGGWTHTPWIAVLDPAVTETVQEGFYVVYLLSRDGERLYLSLNQGCTTLHDKIGARASDELRRRSEIMWGRIRSQRSAFKRTKMNLGSGSWRGPLYEAGDVANIEYYALALPPEQQLRDDLTEALRLYRHLDNEGGWSPEDDIVREAQAEGRTDSLEQAKRYRQHRSIERISSHARKVKAAQGLRCRGCDWEMAELYGSAGAGIAHAHHLLPLSQLADGEVARFDPVRDFAVLCPNCHAVIHRMPDVGDLDALRLAVQSTAKIRPRHSS